MESTRVSVHKAGRMWYVCINSVSGHEQVRAFKRWRPAIFHAFEVLIGGKEARDD